MNMNVGFNPNYERTAVSSSKMQTPQQKQQVAFKGYLGQQATAIGGSAGLGYALAASSLLSPVGAAIVGFITCLAACCGVEANSCAKIFKGVFR
jgi:hypothetical protein